MMMQLSRYSLSTVLDWSYGGVNSSIPGNGGPDCASFISLERRLFETLLASVVSVMYTWWGWRCITLPATLPFVRKDRGGKRLLLVVVSLVFGMEIGFKFATKQLIYLLNPCHIITALQIYLLAAPPSRFVTVLFRVHLNFLNGAVLAMLFPVTNSRLLPCEEEIYWLQHSLMLVTPYYLLRLGGVYTIEDLRDMSWTVMSTGFAFLYHFLPLQSIAMLSEVNLNNMLCPAISDPFYGPRYRLAALVHQSVAVPLVSKTFCAVATFFLTVCPFTKVKDHLGTDVTMSSYSRHYRDGYHDNGSNCHANGECVSGMVSSCSSSSQHRRSLSDINSSSVRLRSNAGLFSSSGGSASVIGERPKAAAADCTAKMGAPCSTKADSNDNLATTSDGVPVNSKISMMPSEGNGCFVKGEVFSQGDLASSACDNLSSEVAHAVAQDSRDD